MSDFIHHAFSLADGRMLSDREELALQLLDPAPAWVHMKADMADAQDWIASHLAYLPEPVKEALISPNSRPRVAAIGDGVLLILRGLNTNPGAEPEDMVSVRLWVEEARIVTLSLRDLSTVRELADLVASGAGPVHAGDFLCAFLERLQGKISDYTDQIDLEGDEIEKAMLDHPDPALRGRVTDIRGELVDLRQFVLPQRDALARLAALSLPVIADEHRLRLGEVHDEASRIVEVVESLRERLVVIRDELSAALDERLNRNLYRLSMISAVFLPLGVLTGLLGVNLAGIPGAERGWAFWAFSGSLVLIALFQVALLRRLRWL